MACRDRGLGEVLGVLLQHLRHIGRGQTRDEAFDGAVIALRDGTGLITFHSVPDRPNSSEPVPSRQQQRVRLVAIELQDLLVAQIERCAIQLVSWKAETRNTRLLSSLSA